MEYDSRILKTGRVKIESEKVPQCTHLTEGGGAGSKAILAMPIKIHIHSYYFSKRVFIKPLSISMKYNQPIYYEDAPVSCRLMMGGGVLIKICSKAVRSHLHF